MNQNDVLELFKKEAAKLNRAFFRQNDMVQLLASLVANSKEQLSKESFEALVHIGSAIYKSSLVRASAQADIAAIMRQSMEAKSQKLNRFIQ